MDKTNRLQALICVVLPEVEDALVDVLYENNVRAINVLVGQGMKKFHLLDSLRSNWNQKSVIISFIKKENEKNIFSKLSEKIFTKKELGIAFTIDVDAAAGGKSIFGFFDKFHDYFENESEEKKIEYAEKIKELLEKRKTEIKSETKIDANSDNQSENEENE